MPDKVFTRRARRAALDLTRVIERVQMVGSPLVLVMELYPPGEKYRSWFPGMERRMEQMNDVLRQVVAEAGKPQVRFFPTQEVLAVLAATGDPINPDGAHFTPPAHRALGQALATEIAEWVDQEGHLVHESGTLQALRR